MQMKFSTEMHEYVLFIYSVITLSKMFKKKKIFLLTWNDNLKNDQNLCWS